MKETDREGIRNAAARFAPALRMWAADGRRPLPRVRFEPGHLIPEGDPDRIFTLPGEPSDPPDAAERIAGLSDMHPPRETDFPVVYRWPGVGMFTLESTRETNRRLEGKAAIVTGAAQGFGRGIAEGLADRGARVVLADLNAGAAQDAADAINRRLGSGRAIALETDVGSEESVAGMVREAVLAFGGLDILISNAGILCAGGLEELSLQDFERVTRVNYTAFFLCAKYAAAPMRTAAEMDPRHFSDIIQINSKSGLQGSNRNFAYAGGKFGGIGLVQSFALELAPHRIKVNAVCPGNYLDGPLWSDPENGLFIQYLRAGKVPGAKTVRDVREAYAAKVPLGRGCMPEDVVRGIVYLVEQEYETGQALPVTGGQVMLK
ncbi:MAG: SDR family NAD(P)-dependent oxidoreductase [Clostridia bacterium]|nr:SDR family NAD(P)-dependent oxidoreductase [Clostridia bacterium]